MFGLETFKQFHLLEPSTKNQLVILVIYLVAQSKRKSYLVKKFFFK